MNKQIYSGVLTVLLLPAFAAFAEEDVVTQSFSAKAGDNLYVKVDRGSIRVLTGDSDKVEIQVVREARRVSAERAGELFEQHKIEFSQEGDTVRIEADNPRPRLRFGRNPFNNLRVEYTIKVPSRFDLELRTAGGNIEVADLEGEVQAHTSGGSLNLGTIDGQVNARTSGGNIRIKGSKGKVDAHTSGGSIKIGNVEGDLVAKTSGGNISLERILGAIDAETSGGSIQVSAAQGPVRASTSGGNVSAELAQQPAGDCAFKTSGGSVRLTIPESLAVDVDARTSGGRVSSDFPGEFNKQRTKLMATLNGGGPNLVLSTSGGNVDVRKK